MSGLNHRVTNSECGRYLCVTFWSKERTSWWEAWSKDGKIHFAYGPRATSWNDRHFAVPFAIGGYSAEKTGQKSGSFTLQLLCCNAQIVIDPFKGNSIIDGFDVVFRRKVPRQNVPVWLRRYIESKETAP